MAVNLDYLEDELRILERQLDEQKTETSEWVAKEVENFIAAYHLKPTNPQHKKLIDEYGDLKTKLYKRELDAKEEKLLSLTQKIEYLKQQFLDKKM